MQITRTCAAVGILIAFVSGTASAAIVAPGGTNPAVNVDPEDLAPPAGDVVAQNTQVFLIEYDLASLGYTTNNPQSFDATLTSSVIRDPVTQRLTFVYQW